MLSSRTIALGGFFLFMPFVDRTAPQCIGVLAHKTPRGPGCRSRRPRSPAPTEVALGRLDGGVTEQELDLFQIAACLAAELGAGPPQIRGGSETQVARRKEYLSTTYQIAFSSQSARRQLCRSPSSRPG